MSAETSERDDPAHRAARDAEDQRRLEEVVGYLNFSEGASDPTFLRNLSELYRSLESRASRQGDADQAATVDVLGERLRRKIGQLTGKSGAFGDVSQASRSAASANLPTGACR